MPILAIARLGPLLKPRQRWGVAAASYGQSHRTHARIRFRSVQRTRRRLQNTARGAGAARPGARPSCHRHRSPVVQRRPQMTLFYSCLSRGFLPVPGIASRSARLRRRATCAEAQASSWSDGADALGWKVVTDHRSLLQLAERASHVPCLRLTHLGRCRGKFGHRRRRDDDAVPYRGLSLVEAGHGRGLGPPHTRGRAGPGAVAGRGGDRRACCGRAPGGFLRASLECETYRAPSGRGPAPQPCPRSAWHRRVPRSPPWLRCWSSCPPSSRAERCTPWRSSSPRRSRSSWRTRTACTSCTRRPRQASSTWATSWGRTATRRCAPSTAAAPRDWSCAP